MRRRRGSKGTALALLAALWLVGMTTTAQANYTRTRYPIVLAHGLSGFDQLFGVYEYWFRIPSALRSGGATVFVTEVSQFADAELRGEQLLAQVEEIVAITGKGKVNLIGHSMGGFDARYVASVRPDLVASVTTIATPHKGAELATFLRANVREGGFTEQALSFFAERLGDVVALVSGARQPQDGVDALESLSADGAARFNARHPQGLPATRCGQGAAQVNGVRYYSWSGTRVFTNIFDISDGLLALTSLVYSEPNDGLVGRCSSHFGQVIRDNYPQNHLDEVNQILGLVRFFGPSPRSQLRAHANRLRRAGL
ncbi:MAG: lipase family alpha/beta hydrolase [Bradymonadia bacterium]